MSAIFPRVWQTIADIQNSVIDFQKDLYNQNSLPTNTVFFVRRNTTDSIFTSNDPAGTERGLFVTVPSTWNAIYSFTRPSYYDSDMVFKVYTLVGTTLTLNASRGWNINASGTISFTFNPGTLYVISITLGANLTNNNNTINFGAVVKRSGITHTASICTGLTAESFFLSDYPLIEENNYYNGGLEKRLVQPVIPSDEWEKDILVFARVESGSLPPGINFDPINLKFTGTWNGSFTGALVDPITQNPYFEAMILLAKKIKWFDSYSYQQNEHIHYATRYVKFTGGGLCVGDFNWDEHREAVVRQIEKDTLAPIQIEDTVKTVLEQMREEAICLCPEVEEFLIRNNK